MSFTEGAGYVLAWPALCARAYGLYEREGLDVDLVVCSESAATEGLVSGEIPFARRSADPHLGTIDAGAPVRVLAGLVAKPPLQLFARADLGSIAALRGETLAGTHAMNTGAMLLRMVLTDGGLADGTYAMRDVGRAANRFGALQAGEVAAALLTPPASAHAERLGFSLLCNLAQAYPRFAYALLHVNTRFAVAQRAALVALLRSEIRAVRWLRDPNNRAAAVAELARATGMGSPDAELCYVQLVERDDAYAHDLAIDPERIGILVDALRRFTDTRPARPPAEYLDTVYLDEARAGSGTE